MTADYAVQLQNRPRRLQADGGGQHTQNRLVVGGHISGGCVAVVDPGEGGCLHVELGLAALQSSRFGESNFAPFGEQIGDKFGAHFALAGGSGLVCGGLLEARAQPLREIGGQSRAHCVCTTRRGACGGRGGLLCRRVALTNRLRAHPSQRASFLWLHGSPQIGQPRCMLAIEMHRTRTFGSENVDAELKEFHLNRGRVRLALRAFDFGHQVPGVLVVNLRRLNLNELVGNVVDAATKSLLAEFLFDIDARGLQVEGVATGAGGAGGRRTHALMRLIPIGTDTHIRDQRHAQFGHTRHALRQRFLYDFQFAFRHFKHQLIVHLHDEF